MPSCGGGRDGGEGKAAGADGRPGRREMTGWEGSAAGVTSYHGEGWMELRQRKPPTAGGGRGREGAGARRGSRGAGEALADAMEAA